MYKDSQGQERVRSRVLVTAKGLVKIAEILTAPKHWMRAVLLRAVSIGALLCALSTPARADPIITPLILSAVGVSAGASVPGPITAGAIASVAASTITFGATFGAELLLNRPKSQQPTLKFPQAPVALEPEIQPTADRFYTYGRVRAGGVFIFREASGFQLGFGIALELPPGGWRQSYIVDDEIWVTGTGTNSGRGAGSDRIRANGRQFRPGCGLPDGRNEDRPVPDSDLCAADWPLADHLRFGPAWPRRIPERDRRRRVVAPAAKLLPDAMGQHPVSRRASP